MEINHPELKEEYVAIWKGFKEAIPESFRPGGDNRLPAFIERARNLGRQMKAAGYKKERFFNPYYLNKAWEEGYDNPLPVLLA